MTSYHEMIRDSVEDTMRLINQYVETFMDEIWPSLVELKPPKERMAWYNSIDWAALRETSEVLWQRMSADAQKLMLSEEKRLESAVENYGQLASTQLTAYQRQTRPLGANAGIDLGMALPMGRAA